MIFNVESIDGASNVLARISERISERQPLNAALGYRAALELRAHFEQRNSEPNSRGWTSANFWARIRTATAFVSADQNEALVTISDPAINQKIFGGTITPKEGKYLALPAISEAYGRSPRVMNNLMALIRWKDGRRQAVALVETQSTQIKIGRARKDGTRQVAKVGESWGGRVWYWLVKSVTQAPDARALPSQERLEAALLEEAEFYLEHLT